MTKAGEKRSELPPSSRSKGLGCSGLIIAALLMRRQ